MRATSFAPRRARRRDALRRRAGSGALWEPAGPARLRSPERSTLGSPTALCSLLFMAASTLAGPPAALADRPRGFERLSAQAPSGRLALRASMSLALGTFDRPERACAPRTALATPIPVCPEGDSIETGVGFGLGLAVRIREPLHLSWGLEVAFTDPELDALAPQTMVMMPFGILLTWSQWSVRPVLEAVAVPFVLLPDGVKNIQLGGRGGVAVRIDDVDLSVTIGHAYAEAVRPWELRLSLVHRP